MESLAHRRHEHPVAAATTGAARSALEDLQLVAKDHYLDVAVQMIGASDKLDQTAQQQVHEREEHGRRKSEQVDGLTNVPIAIYADVYTVPSVGGDWEPVRPLTLQARQMAGVEMRVTLTKCWSDVKWNTIPVTFTVYGIELMSLLR